MNSKGVAKIVDIVGKENVSFDIDVLKSQNDSFYTTHHPPNPEVQRPSAVVFLPQLKRSLKSLKSLMNIESQLLLIPV